MARYRITFVSRFTQTVEANNSDEARRLADILSMPPHNALLEAPDSVEGLSWNTIEPLDSSGD